MHQEAIILTTPTEISYARLATLKGALKLESKGLKSRAGPLRPQVAAELGLKPRDSYDKFIATIQSKMDAMLAERQNG